ncbi:MAG: T9SS type A sorting domain-containing protein [Candidatus Cloacimonadaceae bacterium]
MKALYLIIIIVLLSTLLLAYEITVPNMPAGMCFKDMNNDGFRDIIVGHRTTWNSTSPNISILVNDGYGRFCVVDSSITSCGYQDYPILDDINNDGDTDLVTMSVDFSTGTAQRFFRIYTNFGLGNHPYIDYPLQRNGTIDKWICFAAPDSSHYLAFICNQQTYWGYIHISYTGQLINQFYYDLSFYPQDINNADIDDNGYNDVLIQGASAEIWKGFSYGFDHVSLSGQVPAEQGFFADFDNNGINEYVALYKMLLPYSVISVYSIDADSIFRQYFFFVDQTSIYPQTGDIDNDGYLDLVYNSSFYAPLHDSDISYTWIIKNIAGVLDSIPIAYYTGYSSYMSYIIDVNNDGWNDIVTSNRRFPGRIHILYNDYTGHFIQDSPTANEDDNAIMPLVILTCYPNPFRHNITFCLKNQKLKGNSSYEIYNIKGQKVKTISNRKSYSIDNKAV